MLSVKRSNLPSELMAGSVRSRPLTGIDAGSPPFTEISQRRCSPVRKDENKIDLLSALQAIPAMSLLSKVRRIGDPPDAGIRKMSPEPPLV